MTMYIAGQHSRGLIAKIEVPWPTTQRDPIPDLELTMFGFHKPKYIRYNAKPFCAMLAKLAPRSDLRLIPLDVNKVSLCDLVTDTGKQEFQLDLKIDIYERKR